MGKKYLGFEFHKKMSKMARSSVRDGLKTNDAIVNWRHHTKLQIIC